MLRDAAEVLGADRKVVVCRELTKKFEERRAGSLAEMSEFYAEQPPRGEIVVVIDRGAGIVTDQDTLDRALTEALESMSVKDAASDVAQRFGVPRRAAYQRAMALGKSS
jgi:16S rRNA (cytidine1402-2'-O)-methyltransferase